MMRSIAFAAALCCCLTAADAAWGAQRSEKTPYYSLALAADGSNIASLSVDSLGKGQFRPSVLFPPDAKAAESEVGPESSSSTASHSSWRFRFSRKSFRMESVYRHGAPATAMILLINPEVSHATLLALVNDREASLPALLHLPEQGSLRIEAKSKQPVRLGYDARRSPTGYIKVTFPGATESNPRIVYSFTMVAIYPHLAWIRGDARFDGFRRDFLNAFQVQAENGVLANNSASDACAFALHMYAEVARYTPPLAKGLTAMDLVRMSLDKYLNGFLGYGLPGYRYFGSTGGGVTGYKTPSSDSYPSLLIAASDYVEATGDTEWLSKHYPGLRKWTEAMLATDTNGNGLIKYSASGNANSWPRRADGGAELRPANWWDTIGFGYEDAYSNALAYHALQGMAELARLDKKNADAERYSALARKLKEAYVPAFFDPKTGVLAGWRSEDGKLHDYYFPWVNGAAVVYGLVPAKLGNSIFDRLLMKMKEVGYTNFELGLPGNLIPIRREDSVTLIARYGGPHKADGSDGFQIYDNGGATAAFAYYTIAALYKLGRVEDGDRILFPMLKSFKAGGFEGRGPNGMTYDWKAWDGTPHGYEGFLADGYMTFAAVIKRPATAPKAQ
jgi:hypothetical protein